MKIITPFFTFLLLFIGTIPVFSQTSKGFNYQAVARDNGGSILSNSDINLRFQIRESTADGKLIYQEKHTLTTNELGLVQTSIGKGVSEVGDFSRINWNSNDYYLVVELNGTSVDTTLFEGVPYAKVATSMKISDLVDVDNSTATNGDVLRWNGNRWRAEEDTETDGSTTNEIQTMALSGNTLSLSLGGGSVNLASFQSPWNNSGSNLYFNTGKVGIGDNSPVATLTVGNGDKLQIHGSDGDVVFKDDQGSLRFANSNGSNAPMIHMFQSGTNNSTRMLVAHSPNFSSWGIQYNDTADAFNWVGDNEPIFQVQLSGQQRLGVGTFKPEAKVHVLDNSSAGTGHLKLTETQFDYSRITLDNEIHDRFWDLAARADTNLSNAQFNVFYDGVGDILSVNARRRVGINDASPAWPLDVKGNGAERTISVENTVPATNTSTFNYGVIANLSQAPNSGFPRLFNVYGFSTDDDSFLSYGVYGLSSNASNFNYGVYGVAAVEKGYAVYASGNTYSTGMYLPSDERLKSGIKPMTSALSKILSLQPTTYLYDTEKYDFMHLPDGVQYGFIAQELEELLPSLTKKSFHAYDKPLSNSPEGQGIEFTALNYTGLVPILVAGMQEQQQVIEDQAQKIQLLEQRLTTLEELIQK